MHDIAMAMVPVREGDIQEIAHHMAGISKATLQAKNYLEKCPQYIYDQVRVICISAVG